VLVGSGVSVEVGSGCVGVKGIGVLVGSRCVGVCVGDGVQVNSTSSDVAGWLPVQPEINSIRRININRSMIQFDILYLYPKIL
jgi:hypothetical protein